MSSQATTDIDHGVHGVGLYVKIFLLLLVLLAVTVGAAMFHLPPTAAILLAMAIATTKAYFIVMYFMHMKWSGRLIAVMFLSSVYVLGLGAILLFGDYMWRQATY